MREAIKASLGLLTPKQRAIYLSLVSIRVVVNFLDVLGLAAVGLLGAMLASGLTDKTEARFLGYTVTIQSSADFLVMVALIAALFIGKSVLATIFLRLTTLFLSRVEGRIATEVITHIYSGDLSRVRRFSKGDLQWVASSSVQTATTGLLSSSAAIVTETALFLSVFVVFVVVDGQTALIITGYFLLLFGVFQLGINQRLKRLGQRIQKNTVGYVDALTDLTTGFREISVLGKREVFLSRFTTHRSQFAKDWATQAFLMGLPRFFVESALMVGVLALVGYQFARGTLSDGLVTTAVFMTGGVRMMAALLPLQNALANIRLYSPQATVAYGLVEEARSLASLEEQPDRRSPSVTDIGSRDALSVSVRAVTFTHPDAEKAVLDNVSMEIPAGSFVALVGPSGAGKTTLADLILGVNSPDAGQVTLGGQSPRDIIGRFPGSVTYVPQSPGLVAGTIAQNVALGVPDDLIDRDQVNHCLEQAQLGEFVRGLPEGIDSFLGKNVDALSGGQKQRLGLARALYTSPRLLVLDEATSALDASTEASISDTISGLGSDVTVVVIAHRLSTIQHADVVFVIDQGGIVARGTFPEVRRKVPMIEEYVRLMTFDQTDDV